MNIEEAWTSILKDAAGLIDALEAGRDAVDDLIADLANDYLLTVAPPYSAAVTACGAIPGCDDKLKSLRRSIVHDVLDTAGVGAIINDMIKAYHAIPAAIRHTLRDAAKVADDIYGVLTDPSFAGVVAALSDCSSLITDGVTYVLGTAWSAAAWAGREFEDGVAWIGRTSVEAATYAAEHDPVVVLLGDILQGKNVAEAIGDSLVAPLHAITDLFSSGGNDYDGRWEWNLPLYGVGLNLARLFTEDASYAQPTYDENAMNFGRRNSGILYGCNAPTSQLNARLWTAFYANQESGTIAKRIAISCVMRDCFALDSQIKAAMVRDIATAPDAVDPLDASGLWWLFGPGGYTVMISLFNLIQAPRSQDPDQVCLFYSRLADLTRNATDASRNPNATATLTWGPRGLQWITS